MPSLTDNANVCARHKILLVDDDQDMLDLYREILSQLPSRPEVFTSLSGPRAMAMLEADQFTLLVCDLNMPKMDGLQVLSVVRRKYPELRTVVLTSVLDEQFRSRAYGLGVDLFWQKPGSNEEVKQFSECVESLLGRDSQAGFRGVQSKSLVDIIQLECLSHNSTTLRIVNGPVTGKIWIHEGEIIDAETEGGAGEAAFHTILSWKSGSFESLPAEPQRTRTIFNSYHGLLLETAQAQDEAKVQVPVPDPEPGNGAHSAAMADVAPDSSPLAAVARLAGVEFALALKPGVENNFDARGLENPEAVATWSRQSLLGFRSLGDRLKAGLLQEVEGCSPMRHVVVAAREPVGLCLGWHSGLSDDQIRESLKKALALWTS